MASQQKIQVLGVGPLETGTGRSGSAWFRRTLQIWTGEVAGNHPYYAEKEALEALQPGNYMIDVAPRAADRGHIEFQIVGISAVSQGKAANA